MESIFSSWEFNFSSFHHCWSDSESWQSSCFLWGTTNISIHFDSHGTEAWNSIWLIFQASGKQSNHSTELWISILRKPRAPSVISIQLLIITWIAALRRDGNLLLIWVLTWRDNYFQPLYFNVLVMDHMFSIPGDVKFYWEDMQGSYFFKSISLYCSISSFEYRIVVYICAGIKMQFSIIRRMCSSDIVKMLSKSHKTLSCTLYTCVKISITYQSYHQLQIQCAYFIVSNSLQ